MYFHRTFDKNSELAVKCGSLWPMKEVKKALCRKVYSDTGVDDGLTPENIEVCVSLSFLSSFETFHLHTLSVQSQPSLISPSLISLSLSLSHLSHTRCRSREKCCLMTAQRRRPGSPTALGRPSDANKHSHQVLRRNPLRRRRPRLLRLGRGKKMPQRTQPNHHQLLLHHHRSRCRRWRGSCRLAGTSIWR